MAVVDYNGRKVDSQDYVIFLDERSFPGTMSDEEIGIEYCLRKLMEMFREMNGEFARDVREVVSRRVGLLYQEINRKSYFDEVVGVEDVPDLKLVREG
jgi:hypothetical protein